MQEQFKYRYFIDGKEIDTREEYFNTTMSGDYVSYFDGDSVFSVSFSDFFGENKDNNKMIKREVNGHLSDAINSRLQLSKKINEETLEKYKSLFKPIDQTQYNTLDLGQIKGSSTRHKSQNGETHKELTAEKTEKVRVNFYRYINNNPIIEVKQFSSLQEAKNYFTNSEWSEVFYYVYGTADLIDKDSKIAEKENKTEENLVFQKDSEIHKEDNVDLIIAEALHRFGKKHLEDKNHETFIVGEGVKESQTTEAYKEIEGKLFYELDWGFITQMAERMASNKKDSKYSLWNWKNPMTPKGIEDLKQATLRHLLEVLEGRYEDDGREFGHIEAISDNMMMINYQLKNNEEVIK